MLNVLTKLNIGQQMEIRAYINKQVESRTLKMEGELHRAATEREENIKEQNNQTWQMIETWLHRAMREHHISEERIKHIDARVLELSKEYEGKLLIGEDLKSDYKVMTGEDFRSIIENLIDSNCRNCNKHHKECSVFKILKKYGIPYPTGERKKCKYGYK
jgi:quinol monooxygenase YgiN